MLSALATGPVAAGYPDRIVRIVVPFAPGGGTDVIARALAQEMAKDLGGSDHHREQAGGGDHHRHPVGRDQRARRLHAADGHLCQRGQSEPEREAALRRAGRFCAGVAAGALVQPRGGQSGFPDQIDCRPDRGGESGARQAHLRHLRHRHLGASRGRIVQAHGQGRSDHRALQGRRARHHRPDRRADPGDLHDGRQCRFAGRGRSVARDRRDLGGTLGGISATADRLGSRRSRLCGGSLVRPLCAGQNAARDHRSPEHVRGESAAVRRLQAFERERGPRHGRRSAGGARPLFPRPSKSAGAR